MLCYCHVQAVGFKPRRGEAKQSRTFSTSTHSDFSEPMIATCFVKALSYSFSNIQLNDLFRFPVHIQFITLEHINGKESP